MTFMARTQKAEGTGIVWIKMSNKVVPHEYLDLEFDC